LANSSSTPGSNKRRKEPEQIKFDDENHENKGILIYSLKEIFKIIEKVLFFILYPYRCRIYIIYCSMDLKF